MNIGKLFQRKEVPQATKIERERPWDPDAEVRRYRAYTQRQQVQEPATRRTQQEQDAIWAGRDR